MADSDGISHKRPPRWLRGWRLMVTLTVTAVMLVVLSLMTVVMLSGNLKPVIERAKHDGLPTTWAELGLTVNPQHAALIKQMEALLAANKNYGSTYVYSGSVSYIIGHPGTPIPEGYIAHVKKRSAKDRQQLGEWMATLREPIRAVSAPDAFTWYKCSGVLQRVHQLAIEEFQAAEDPSVEQAENILNFSQCIPPDSLWQLSMRSSCMSASARAIRFHLNQLRMNPGHLPGLLRHVAADLDHVLEPASRGEFVFMTLAVQVDPELFAKNGGVSLPEILEYPLCMTLAHRLGRVEFLEDERAWSMAIRASPDPRGPVPPKPFTMPHIPAMLMSRIYRGDYPARSAWYVTYPRTRLRLLATAAALDDAPWPVDPWSTSGALLHELRNADGVVLAVYAVGNNGRDDGGKLDDLVIELRAPKEAAIKAAAAAAIPPSP